MRILFNYWHGCIAGPNVSPASRWMHTDFDKRKNDKKVLKHNPADIKLEWLLHILLRHFQLRLVDIQLLLHAYFYLAE